MRHFIMRLKLAWKIIRGKDFMLITMKGEEWQVANTFPGDQISKSGKAIYLN